MKSCPFVLVFASNKMPEVPITSSEALELGFWLVDGEFASQWSSKVASPKLELELSKASGKTKSSARSRAPALG
jgi:hypothetical protein